MKENVYVVIDDIYITQINEDEYMLTDAEVTKLIAKYRQLEFRYDQLWNKSKKDNMRAEKNIDYYRNLAHTYKVELGRCRRKLQRIYERIRKDALACYVLGIIDCKPNELVDLIKHT